MGVQQPDYRQSSILLSNLLLFFELSHLLSNLVWCRLVHQYFLVSEVDLCCVETTSTLRRIIARIGSVELFRLSGVLCRTRSRQVYYLDVVIRGQDQSKAK